MNLVNTAQPYAIGGNPKLGPVKKTAYDASLEWYFGATGSISLAAWQWNQDGLVADQQLPEYLPASPDVPTLVKRPYNLGTGRHRGLEGSATTFFTFLPGILKSFGGSVNGTLNITHVDFPPNLSTSVLRSCDPALISGYPSTPITWSASMNAMASTFASHTIGVRGSRPGVTPTTLQQHLHRPNRTARCIDQLRHQ